VNRYIFEMPFKRDRKTLELAGGKRTIRESLLDKGSQKEFPEKPGNTGAKEKMQEKKRRQQAKEKEEKTIFEML